MEARWHVKRGNREVGPVNFSDVLSWAKVGKLRPSDKLRREGEPDWRQATNFVITFKQDPVAAQSPSRSEKTDEVTSISSAQHSISDRAHVSGALVAASVKSSRRRIRWALVCVGLATSALLTAIASLPKVGDQITAWTQRSLGEAGGQQRQLGKTNSVLTWWNSLLASDAALPPATVDVPDFAEVNYSFDFSTADYDAVPEGRMLETRRGLRRDLYPDSKGSQEADYWIEEQGYVSDDQRFVCHGKTNVWFSKDKKQLSQQFTMLHGAAHGPNRYWYPNGQLSDDRVFVENQQHGREQLWYDNGQLKCERWWFKGVLHGVEKWWTENGTPNVWTTKVDGMMHGPHRKWDKDGRVDLTNEYKHDEPWRGPCEWVYNNRKRRFLIDYIDGKRHGECREYFPNGTLRAVHSYSNDNLQFHGRPSISEFDMMMGELIASGRARGNWPLQAVVRTNDFEDVFGEPVRTAQGRIWERWDVVCKDGVLTIDKIEQQANSVALYIANSTVTRSKWYCSGRPEAEIRSKLEAVLGTRRRAYSTELFQEVGYPTVDAPLDGAAQRLYRYDCRDGVVLLTVSLSYARQGLVQGLSEPNMVVVERIE